MTEILAGGGPRHRHATPDDPAYKHRWNTVGRSSCGHLWVRRYTWLAACIPLSDHFPEWRRLRPWHLSALVRLALGRRPSWRRW